MSLNQYPSIKKIYIENLGCSKNQVDAEIMASELKDRGCEICAEPCDADLILVNTCGFISAAKEESINTALEFRKSYPDKKIIMSGCLSQRYGQELALAIPELDGFFGNNKPELISEFISKIENKPQNTQLWIPDLQKEYKIEKKRDKFYSFPGSAYVKISEGCNHWCSYCAIPLIRGDLRSRAESEIIEEIAFLLDSGIVELNFVAQDLCAYGKDTGNTDFYQLLKRISEMKGDFWLRMLYIHPDDFDTRILEICKNDSRILPYFDIPFQHASETVLKNMNRKGNPSVYLELIQTIREQLPLAVIRSTFMTGFPNSSDDDFKVLLDFQQKADLDWAGFFIYSKEENTKAAELAEGLKFRKVQKNALKEKLLLEAAQLEITINRLERFVGSKQKVLVEEKIEGENLYLGRAYFQAPEVDGVVVIIAEYLESGKFYDCIINKVNGVDLEAVPST